jgi:hypothetical protein
VPARRVPCYEPMPQRRRALEALLRRLGCEALFFDDLPAVRAALAQQADPGDAATMWLVAADAPDSCSVMEAVRAAGVVHALLGKVAGPAADATLLSRPVTCSALREWLRAAGPSWRRCCWSRMIRSTGWWCAR